MNAAHFHLLVNHFPLIGLFFALPLLIYGSLRSNEHFVRAGLFVALVAGLLAAPTFLTGEPAEEILEKLPGFSEPLVEAHEEAAEFAIWVISITTLAAAVALWASVKKNTNSKMLIRAVIVLNLFSLVVMARTSQLGGKIAHPEIRDSNAPSSPAHEGHD